MTYEAKGQAGPREGGGIGEGVDRIPPLDEILPLPWMEWKLNEIRLVRQYSARPQETRVSVVIPTWNRAKVLPRALRSVLRQSYANLEVLVSDDGSTDETKGIVEAIARTDSRVLYFQESHRGACAARNAALRRATGEIVAYLDSDNEWSENYLLIMVNSLLDAPRAAAAYCGIGVRGASQRMRFTRLVEYDRERLLTRNYVDINIFIHRRELFERLGGFDETIQVMADWDLVIRYTEESPPLVVKGILATYHVDPVLGHLSLSPQLEECSRRIREKHGGRDSNVPQ